MTKETKKPNNRAFLGALLFLLLYVMCASLSTEGAQQTIAWHVTPLPLPPASDTKSNFMNIYCNQPLTF